jgi:hypothetical protein
MYSKNSLQAHIKLQFVYGDIVYEFWCVLFYANKEIKNAVLMPLPFHLIQLIFMLITSLWYSLMSEEYTTIVVIVALFGSLIDLAAYYRYLCAS